MQHVLGGFSFCLYCSIWVSGCPVVDNQHLAHTPTPRYLVPGLPVAGRPHLVVAHTPMYLGVSIARRLPPTLCTYVYVWVFGFHDFLKRLLLLLVVCCLLFPCVCMLPVVVTYINGVVGVVVGGASRPRLKCPSTRPAHQSP